MNGRLVCCRAQIDVVDAEEAIAHMHLAAAAGRRVDEHRFYEDSTHSMAGAGQRASCAHFDAAADNADAC